MSFLEDVYFPTLPRTHDLNMPYYYPSHGFHFSFQKRKFSSIVLVWDEFLFLFHSSMFSKIKYCFHCYIAGSFPLQHVHSLASSWSHDMLQ